MAFQDSAESLAEKLHLSRVPRPVFAAKMCIRDRCWRALRALEIIQ